MDKLLQRILSKEFTIDEQRETVAVADEPGEQDPPQAHADLAQGPEAAGTAAEEDLFSQIAGMLTEQERLQNLAEELTNRQSKPAEAEFTDFFKRSLPVLDSLDRIMHMYEILDDPPEELRNWIKSVAGLRTRVTNLYEGFGLRIMDPVGKVVNLDRHEVVEVIHTDSIPDETVVETRQKGYVYTGKVLRDARVVVAKNVRSG